jgi:hypothetical protein
MSKKFLALAIVLALVAIIIAPTAVFADTTGNMNLQASVTPPTISITAPSGIVFGQLKFGTPSQDQSALPLAVNVTLGSANTVGWSVTALDTSYGNGYMWVGSYGSGTHMNQPLLIGPDGSTWYYANGTGSYGTLTYTGTNNGQLKFYAQQTSVPADAGGTYNDVIVFSATITSVN